MPRCFQAQLFDVGLDADSDQDHAGLDGLGCAVLLQRDSDSVGA